MPILLISGADVVRTHLSKGLGFSREDRDTNIRRIGWVCQLLTKHGVPNIAAAISPYREVREEVRKMVGRFVEVYVNGRRASRPRGDRVHGSRDGGGERGEGDPEAGRDGLAAPIGPPVSRPTPVSDLRSLRIPTAMS